VENFFASSSETTASLAMPSSGTRQSGISDQEAAVAA
jgi:hypothetical protein